ncbi:hypothetical protein SAMN05216582_10278 [Selenomonas ruminantium]|uniref:Uncharacterized protein n=1 Tax=Selenomonas ruminantium TaxID=971 RepID=A0A1M6RHU2_SELRU|nr:hypothetical protein SAMN05216582_10278 [Selenomonas ruminantium]
MAEMTDFELDDEKLEAVAGGGCCLHGKGNHK